jgi:hypothetical protein
VEEHITNYRAARALTDKGRNAGEGAAHHGESSTGLSRNGLRSKRPGFQEQRKEVSGEKRNQRSNRATISSES